MDTVPRRPTSYLISIWPERTADGVAVWRGVLVTPAGQRLPFATLAQLNRWHYGRLAARTPAATPACIHGDGMKTVKDRIFVLKLTRRSL